MTSLRNIMNNVNDESQPRRSPGNSTPKPVPHTSPLPTASYPASSDMSMHHPSPSDYSRGASPHSTYSHTSDSSAPRHPPPHLPLPPGRRDSIGNEHLGYHYAHPAAYGAAHDMRSMMPGAVMPEPGVKLTPITGRVSRAKKGVPVHTCDMCRPPKTFTRAEHLRRHQLSHQPPDLACNVPGCSKVFHRKDLLERHQQRHELEDRIVAPGQAPLNTSPRRQSQGYGSSSQMGSYGGPNSSTSPMSSTPRHDSSAPSNWSSTNRSFGHTLPPPRISASPQQYYAHSPQSRYSADSPPETSPTGDSAHHAAKMQDGSSNLKTPEAGHDFYMSDGDQSNSPGMPSSATGSTYSTPSDSSNDRSKRARSSSTEWSSATTQFAASPDIQRSYNMGGAAPVHFNYGFSAGSLGYSMPRQNMNTQLHMPGYDDDSMMGKSLLTDTSMRTLPMPMPFGAGRSADVLMAAPPILFPNPTMSQPLSVSPPSLGMVDSIMAQGMPILALSQSVREAVPVYLEVYWNKVHPMYPIIHRPTFEMALEAMSEATDILQCTMAAVATQFLGHEDHRINGSQLHFHAACKLKVASGTEHWPLQTMQAVLLSEYYMRFRGRDKDAYQTSPLFTMLYEKAYKQAATQRNAGELGRSDNAWAEWVEDQAQKRLLASCFLLDIHCMRYFERASATVSGPDYSSPSTLSIPLCANTTKPWEACTLDAWLRPNPQGSRLTVGEAIVQGLKPADIQESSPFDASVLLAAYSLQLPTRQNPTRLDLIQDASAIDMSHVNVLNLFGQSAVANTYLALHFTPLHYALSVSGDSWVFNKKVLRLAAFTQHQSQLSRWRDSGSSAAAAAFAARALVAFLGLEPNGAQTLTTPVCTSTDISDFWGIYVCALICWAFGHAGRDGTGNWKDASSRPAALQWLQSAAKLQPAQVQRLSGRRNAQAVVGLAREALEREHFGGRSILIADAVGVLRKLEDGDGCKRF